MTSPDIETTWIKQLTELNRELYLLESGNGGTVFPMWGSSNAGQDLGRIYDLKVQITELEEKLERSGSAKD